MKKIKFFIKKSLLYFIYGMIVSNIPFMFFGMYFGFLPVLFGSISIALADTINLKDDYTEIFTDIHIRQITCTFFVFICIFLALMLIAHWY